MRRRKQNVLPHVLPPICECFTTWLKNARKDEQSSYLTKINMVTPILVFIYDRKKKASPKRAASVKLRLTLERKSKYISTGVRLLPKEWHKGTVVNRPDSAELNELLGTIMVRAPKVTNAMIEAGNLNLDEIPRRMDELTRDKRLFYDFCVERTKVRIYGKSKDTAARYDRFLDWLKKWGKIIYFSDVTDRNIIKMDEELSAIGMKNYSKWNNYHRFLNSFIIDAMDEGFLKRNPYKWVHINKEKNNGLKKHLTFEEFSKLQRAKMPTTSLERVRDLFVFQTFKCMSYVDLENFDASMINSAGVIRQVPVSGFLLPHKIPTRFPLFLFLTARAMPKQKVVFHNFACNSLAFSFLPPASSILHVKFIY